VETNQDWVVRRVENTIHQIITIQCIEWFVLLTVIHWIAIYPLVSVIQPSNNWGQVRQVVRVSSPEKTKSGKKL